LGLLLAVACAVFGAGLLLGAPSASAHALLVRSDPSSGATVATSPKTIELWFNEEITLDLSSVRVVHSDGAVVAGTRLVSASGDPRLLQLSLPPLPNDSYRVLWTATAEDDGHTTTGTVVFGVGVSVAPEAASDAASAPSMTDVARRWIRIGALAGVVGATGILLIFLWIGADPKVELTVTAVERRMFLLAVWSAVVGLGVAAVDGIVQVARVTPGSGRDWLAVFGSTTWGHLWLLRVAALAALLVVTLVLRRSLRVRPGLALLSAALVLALVVIEALGSHAASVESARPAAMLAEAVHILAGCIWVGVVLTLAVMLWRPAVDGLDRRVLLRMIGRPLAVVLLASVGIVIVSGLYSAGRQVETVSDLVTTGYGRALLIKTGLLVVLLALGALNAIRLHGLHLPGRGPAITPVPVVSTRLIVAEAAVGAVLLIVAGLLADSAPSRETATLVASSATEAAASAVERTEAGSVADLVVTVSATPNRPGLNAFTVTAASSRRPAPRPIDTVSLEVVGAKSTVSPPLQPIGAGRYFGVARLDSGPVREMRAVIERNGEQLGVTVPWTVSAATDTARLAPYVNTLAASLAVAFLGLVVGWFVLRRRRPEMKLPDIAEWELVTASSRSVRATATSSDPLAEVIDLDRRPEHEP
jgi:copper transport protein